MVARGQVVRWSAVRTDHQTLTRPAKAPPFLRFRGQVVRYRKLTTDRLKPAFFLGGQRSADHPPKGGSRVCAPTPLSGAGAGLPRPRIKPKRLRCPADHSAETSERPGAALYARLMRGRGGSTAPRPEHLLSDRSGGERRPGDPDVPARCRTAALLCGIHTRAGIDHFLSNGE